jgi:ribonucleoside-diphosphate reductase beta chain
MEILNDPNNLRKTIYPIKHQDIWQFYKKSQACFWSAEEIDFSTDYDDYETLTEDEKHFIKMILSFFASADIIVNINLTENFIKDVQLIEAKVCYEFQAMIENIHSECYSLMIENLIKDFVEKDRCFNAITEFECIKEKADWCKRWIEQPHLYTFGQRLIAFAIVEGVFFSGAFCAIFWFKQKNKMKGLTMSNELIARDEGLHTDFACLLYSKIKNRLHDTTVHQMVIEAVEIEKKFITKSLPCKLLGMNSELMIQYIQFVADRLLVDLGYKKIWTTNNPFDFMESISLEGKTNFFEARPTQYQNSHVLNNADKETQFEQTEDF